MEAKARDDDQDQRASEVKTGIQRQAKDRIRIRIRTKRLCRVPGLLARRKTSQCRQGVDNACGSETALDLLCCVGMSGWPASDQGREKGPGDSSGDYAAIPYQSPASDDGNQKAARGVFWGADLV